MINHARTLLRNMDGEPSAVGLWPGDEYVPPCFRAVELPAPLIAIRRFLFGLHPDRVYINYRLQQYLALLHASELSQFVTHFDSRITYDPRVSAFADDALFRAQANIDGVYVVRELPPADDINCAIYRWRIGVNNDSTVTINRQAPSFHSSTVAYSMTNGLSNELPLPGSNAGFMFNSALGPGTSFKIAGFTRPRRSVGEISAALDQSGRQHLNELFGVGTRLAATEPFRTFRSLWFDHPQLPYKLGGLLAALIFQTERYRTNG